MIFHTEEAFRTISEFNDLPETKEKKEISDLYLKDKIGSYEFIGLARDYLNKIKP